MYVTQFNLIHASIQNAQLQSVRVFCGSRNHEPEKGKTLIELEELLMSLETGTTLLAAGPTRLCIMRGGGAAALFYAFSRSIEQGETRVKSTLMSKEIDDNNLFL